MEADCARNGCHNLFVKKNKKHRFCSTYCTYYGICELCNDNYTKKHSKRRFCSSICSNKYGVNLKETDDKYAEYRKQRNEKLIFINKQKANDENWSEKIGKATKKKNNKIPNNIFDCSTRTRTKILKRLGAKCCICSWNEGSCDVHHIKGRKIVNPHSHTNLTIMCPNHHRLFHEGKIKEEDITTFEQEFGNSWLDVYY